MRHPTKHITASMDITNVLRQLVDSVNNSLSEVHKSISDNQDRKPLGPDAIYQITGLKVGDTVIFEGRPRVVKGIMFNKVWKAKFSIGKRIRYVPVSDLTPKE